MQRLHTGILPVGLDMFPEKLHFEITSFKLEKDGIKR